MITIEQRTPIRFIPKTTETNYVEISSSDAFLSSVGCIGGKQTLTLCNRIEYVQTVVHELLHTVGLHHEHSRVDRDLYLNIHYDNIKSEHVYNYDIKKDIDPLRTAFDYNSVMLYGPTIFSANGKPTLSSRINGVRLLHTYEKPLISDGDVELVCKLYENI